MKNPFMLIALLVTALLTVSAASAVVVYDSIDEPLPGSYPSLGYQATSTAALGDHVAFSETGTLDSVTVTLTNWACENDYALEEGVWVDTRADDEACVTTPGSSFEHPVTINIYEVDNSGADPAVGDLIVTKTVPFDVLYRPSWDSVECTADGETPENVPFGGKWYDPVMGACVFGYNQNIVFDFAADGIVLPAEVIFSVAYNTQSYGAEPIGAPGPYNSLNYGLSSATFVGTDAEPDAAFWDTTYDGYTAGLKRDTGWTPYVPAARFEVAPPDYRAAPAVAADLLKAADIKPRYGEKRDAGNHIADVAQHMGEGTDFNDVMKEDVVAYECEVVKYLRSKDVPAMVLSSSECLELIDTVEVDSKNPTPTLSTSILEYGTDYVLEAHGTAHAGDTIDFDAKYSITNKIPGDTWTDTVSGYVSYGTDLLELFVDGFPVDWGAYNEDHTYQIVYTGTGAEVSFLINDIYYPNNVGSLSVDVYAKLW